MNRSAIAAPAVSLVVLASISGCSIGGDLADATEQSLSTATYDECLAEVLAGEVICIVGVGEQADTSLIGQRSTAECDELTDRGDEPHSRKLCVVTEGPQRGAVAPIEKAT